MATRLSSVLAPAFLERTSKYIYDRYVQRPFSSRSEEREFLRSAQIVLSDELYEVIYYLHQNSLLEDYMAYRYPAIKTS